MLVVALDLDWPVHMALHQQRRCVPAQRERRGIKQRTPRNEFFRLANVRDNRLERLTGAGGHPRQRHGRTHQFEKAAARNRVRPLRRTLGKFAMHHFPELSAAGKFFQAAPEFRTILLLDVRAHLHKIKLVLFAGTNFLAMRLAVLIVVIHQQSVVKVPSLRDSNPHPTLPSAYALG